MPEAAEIKRARNRGWMRDYRATPEGKAASKLAQKKAYATPQGMAARRAGRARWKKSERGKECDRRHAKKKYVTHPRPLLDPEERKRRAKESWLRSFRRPEYQEKRRATAWRSHLRRTYDLSPEEYRAMAMNGCQICGAQDSPKKRLHVDHDHGTGKVRGLLCDHCNRGLGSFRDSPERLARALLYLKGA